MQTNERKRAAARRGIRLVCCCFRPLFKCNQSRQRALAHLLNCLPRTRAFACGFFNGRKLRLRSLSYFRAQMQAIGLRSPKLHFDSCACAHCRRCRMTRRPQHAPVGARIMLMNSRARARRRLDTKAAQMRARARAILGGCGVHQLRAITLELTRVSRDSLRWRPFAKVARDGRRRRRHR